jgi:E3 ubiquitin-protein ligase RNF1/2
MKLDVVRHDTRCPVCWGTLKKVKVVVGCLHRFCGACIEEHLRKLYVPAPP